MFPTWACNPISSYLPKRNENTKTIIWKLQVYSNFILTQNWTKPMSCCMDKQIGTFLNGIQLSSKREWTHTTMRMHVKRYTRWKKTDSESEILDRLNYLISWERQNYRERAQSLPGVWGMELELTTKGNKGTFQGLYTVAMLYFDGSSGCMMVYACQNWSNCILMKLTFCRSDQNSIYYWE